MRKIKKKVSVTTVCNTWEVLCFVIKKLEVDVTYSRKEEAVFEN